jgi:hypothetical protein
MGELRRLRVATLTLSGHQGLEWPLLEITVLGSDPRSAHLGIESINFGNGPLSNSEERAMGPGMRRIAGDLFLFPGQRIPDQFPASKAGCEDLGLCPSGQI